MWTVALLLQAGPAPASAADPPPGWNDEVPAFWSEDVAASEDRKPPAREKPARFREPYEHAFLASLSFGLGLPRSSEQSELLEKDGYRLDARTELELDLLGVIAHRVAVGAYFGTGWRSDQPGAAPTLTETVFRAGGALELVLQPSPSVVILLGPELGVLQGRLSLGSGGDSQRVLEYGGGAALLARMNASAPVWYVGGGASYTVAPADRPGAVGRDYDYGALRLWLTAVLGG